VLRIIFKGTQQQVQEHAQHYRVCVQQGPETTRILYWSAPYLRHCHNRAISVV
jgi:hypothetical protein